MDRRKVVKHGAVTLMVSIPRSWVERLGIAAGDELLARSYRDEIIYRPTARVSVPAEIDLTGLRGSTLRNAVVAAYRFNRMPLRVTMRRAQLPRLHEVVALLPGATIDEVEANGCLLRVAGDVSRVQLDELHRKFLANLLESLSSDHDDRPETDRTIQQLLQAQDNLIRRAISATSKLPELHWSFQSEVMRSQREWYRLRTSKRSIDKEILAAYKESLIKLYELRKSPSIPEVAALQERIAALQDRVLGLSSDGATQARMYAATRMLYLAASPLFAIALHG